MSTTVKPLHYIGYDPGQKKDPAGVVVVQATGDRYAVRYCGEMKTQRFQTQVERIALLAGRLDEPVLVLDASGIGAGVLEMAQAQFGAYRAVGYQITAGSAISGRNVSKSHLLTVLQQVIRETRLTIPDRVETLKLRRQLATWQAESDRGRMTAVNDRTSKGHHFDLACALALVLVHHERRRLFI